MADYQFVCKPFYALTLDELYALMALRQEVFVVEQNCPYLDADGRDQAAWHLMMYDAHGLIGCTRLLPRGVAYPDYPSIGRVVTASRARRTGAGKFLMQKSIAQCSELFGDVALKIGAQSYLRAFYESFGFVFTGEHYMEDGIPHMKMVRQPD